MANSTGIDLPNPFTPMAFLPPDMAYEMTITAYVIIGVLSVLLWDILSHLYADWKLLTEYHISLPTLVYFLSRLSTLAYMLTSTIFQTAPTKKCVALAKTTCSIYHITVSSTALLFFFRIRAVFNKNKYIVAIFFLLWASVLGGSLTAVFSLTGMAIGTTKYCTFINYRPYFSAANVTIAVYDTSVFFAITWHLLVTQNHTKDSGTKFDFFGRHLPSFTRALLRDGQKYYMVVAVLNVLALILDLAPGIPIAYRAILIMPSMSLGNIMACRVFRNTKMHHESVSVSATGVVMFGKNMDTSSGIHNKKESSMGSIA